MPDPVAATAVGGGRGMDAVAFGIAADLVYNIYSATNSSPQTTELFASERSATLWKYVKLGGAQSLLLVGIMAVRGRTFWPILGGAAAATMMHLMYSHALRAGQAGGGNGG